MAIQFRQIYAILVVMVMYIQVSSAIRQAVHRVSRFRRAFSAGSRREDTGSRSGSHRFWTETIEVPALEYDNSDNLKHIEQGLNEVLASNVSKGSVDFGVIMYKDLLLPVHEGVVQSLYTKKAPLQYTTLKQESEEQERQQRQFETATICAFSPRATHVCTPPSEEERPVDPTRLESLNRALPFFTSVEPTALLSDDFAGTPPSRIYRSFVAPRASAVHILEPLDRAANRTAAQIDLALRQVAPKPSLAGLRFSLSFPLSLL
jgi:hypothetical protein